VDARHDCRARHGWLRVLLPSLLTAFLVTASAPGYAHGRAQALLAWIALVPLLAALPTLSRRQAGLAGLVAGTAIHLGWAAWMPGLMARFSGWSPAVAVLAALALALAHGVGWALVVVVGSPDMPCAAPCAYSRQRPSWSWSAGSPASSRGRWGWRTISFAISLRSRSWAGHACSASSRSWSRLLWPSPGWLGGMDTALPGGDLCCCRRTPSRAWPWPGATSADRNGANAGAGSHASPPYKPEPLLPVGGHRKPPNLLARYRKATEDLEREAGRFDLVVWPEKASPVLRRGCRSRLPA
jgi:hypothetical protein